jgi:hypothetical protein
MIGSVWLAVLASAAAAQAPPAPPDGGVLVTAVDRALLGDDVDLRAGDVLRSWAQEDPAGGAPLEGSIDSPFDLAAVETLRCPRGPVVLRGLREGEVFEALVEPEWCSFRNAIEPKLGPEAREAYRRGDGHLRAGRVTEGLAEWRAVADRLPPSSATRCWLLARIGAERIKGKAMEEGRAAMVRAVSCAEEVVPEAVPWVVEQEGHAPARRRRSGRGGPRVRARARPAEPAGCRPPRPGAAPRRTRRRGRAALVGVTSRPARRRGRARLAARARQPAAPAPPGEPADRPSVVRPRVRHRADEAAGGDPCVARLGTSGGRARPERHGPGALEAGASAGSRANGPRGGAVVPRARRGHRRGRDRGDQPARLLGERGDLEGHDDHLRHAAFLLEKDGGRPRFQAVIMNNRALSARARGDLAGALALHASAVAILEELAPQSPLHAAVLGAQASTWLESGDTPSARSGFERTLAIAERDDPRSAFVAETVLQLAKLERREGRPDAAEALYRRALAVFEERGIEQTPQAEA